MIRRGYLDFAWGQVHMRMAEADPALPLLLLLHQSPLSARNYDRLLPLLTPVCRPVAIDTPGYGGSDLPERQWEVADYAALVLAIFASAALYALFQVLARMAAAFDRAETSTLYAVVAGTIVMSAIVPFHFVLPRSAGDAAMMASMGLIGALGHYCIARALAYADASLVSPFNYWQLIGAVILGYAMFGDLPDRWTWIGAAVIVAAGLLLAFGETRAARRRVSAPGR